MPTLPEFLIIGAAKSGTTTLFHALDQHPGIFMPFNKEPSFYNNDKNYALGADWYSNTYFQKAKKNAIRGEATPGYLFWSDKVVPRIQETYLRHGPKFIAIFRDPVKRAYSAYWHLKHYGGESLSFREALEAETSRLASNGDQLKASGFIKYAYFQGGCYATQLQPYLNCFPYKNFRFFLTEDLQTNFSQSLQEIYEFLGVQSIPGQQSNVRNQASRMRSKILYGWIRRRSFLKELIKPFLSQSIRFKLKNTLQNMNMTAEPYPPMDPDLVSILRQRYLDEIRLLETMIGRDLSAWKEGP